MSSTDIIFKKHLHVAPFQIQDKGLIKASESFSNDEFIFDINYEVESDFVLTWGFR